MGNKQSGIMHKHKDNTSKTQSSNADKQIGLPITENPPSDSRTGEPVGKQPKKKDSFVNILDGKDPFVNTIIILLIIICVFMALCMISGWVCDRSEQQALNFKTYLEAIKMKRPPPPMIEEKQPLMQNTQSSSSPLMEEYASEIAF